MVQQICIFLFMLLFSANSIAPEKEYFYEHYTTGTLKAEGWKAGTYKEGFWHFYYPNGVISHEGHYNKNKKTGYWYYYSKDKKIVKEGHYKNNSATDWWVFKDLKTNITRKYEFKNNKKNGFCLSYKNNILFKAERYLNNIKTGEWTDVISFKRDNPNAFQ